MANLDHTLVSCENENGVTYIYHSLDNMVIVNVGGRGDIVGSAIVPRSVGCIFPDKVTIVQNPKSTLDKSIRKVFHGHLERLLPIHENQLGHMWDMDDLNVQWGIYDQDMRPYLYTNVSPVSTPIKSKYLYFI